MFSLSLEFLYANNIITNMINLHQIVIMLLLHAFYFYLCFNAFHYYYLRQITLSALKICHFSSCIITSHDNLITLTYSINIYFNIASFDLIHVHNNFELILSFQFLLFALILVLFLHLHISLCA